MQTSKALPEADGRGAKSDKKKQQREPQDRSASSRALILVGTAARSGRLHMRINPPENERARRIRSGR